MKNWKNWALLAAVAAIIYLIIKARAKAVEENALQPGEETQISDQIQTGTEIREGLGTVAGKEVGVFTAKK